MGYLAFKNLCLKIKICYHYSSCIPYKFK